MFDFIVEYIRSDLKKTVTSRLFALSVLFLFMAAILITRLFRLQIVDGEKYQAEYVTMAEKVIRTPGTRGNIYDRNGNVLAYNELAYSVTIQDIGTYTRDLEWNSMLYKLVNLLNRHGKKVSGSLELQTGADGRIRFTSESEAARLRFLRDYYGLRSVEELTDENGKYPSGITAPELFERLKKEYHLERTEDRDGNPVEVPDDVAVQMLDVRYTMRFTAYQKYETTTIATALDDETVADVLEHRGELSGVDVAEYTNRVYNDALYFAPILGYTGKVTSERLEELKKSDSDYELNDIVGRTGIESTMELELKGKKGSTTAYVDNVGRILTVIDQTEPVAGNDIWLTLDRNLQKGIYDILERQLAGVLLGTIVNQEADTIEYTDSSKIKIPVKNAYFQLINNNVLNIARFSAPGASETERGISEKYEASRIAIFQALRGELFSSQAAPMSELSEEMQAYMQYLYSYLARDEVGIVQRSAVDTSSEEYKAWQEGAMSLRDYLYYGISSSFIDTSRLGIESRYADADEVFAAIVEKAFGDLEKDKEFTKRIFRYLINNNTVTGRELMLALYDQGVLSNDDAARIELSGGNEDTAFRCLMEKIRNIEITPAQLALDPCTASCVVTNVKNGEVLALVTYPSYDNNRIGDISYFSALNEDQSLPLRNNATQTLKAPGSTFKPITAIAGLEENVINVYDTITCTGIYEEIDTPVRCWIYPGFHGSLNVIGAIENSCNVFFNEVGHRLSTDIYGNYSTSKGISQIQKYASMFGLDEPSGIELYEATPHISDLDPERSSMGQGTHQYANVQLARYVTALANRGTVYNLSLVDRETDSAGNLVMDYIPEVKSVLNIQTSTWDAVQQGMRRVITNSSTNKIFNTLEVHVAGKTGTAQESEKRGNHAFFISFAPYENPEIAVTVNIPNGYSSANAAYAANHVYKFYYGFTSLSEIETSGALDASNERVNGD